MTDQNILFTLLFFVFVFLIWGRWRYDLVAFSALLKPVSSSLEEHFTRFVTPHRRSRMCRRFYGQAANEGKFMHKVKSTGLGGVLRSHQLLFSSRGAVAALISLLLVACGSDYRGSNRGTATRACWSPRWPCARYRKPFSMLARLLRSTTSRCSAQVAGYLLERTFEEGQDVEQGAELFLIRSRHFIRPEWPRPRARSPRPSAAVARADKDARRYRILVKNQSVSQQQLDNGRGRVIASLGQS